MNRTTLLRASILVAAGLLPSCAVGTADDGGGQAEDVAVAESAWDDGFSASSTVQRGQVDSCANDIANNIAKVICAAPMVKCPVPPSCERVPLYTELFTGASNLVAPSSVTSPKWNGFGVRGSVMANAGLCMLQDLAKGDVTVKTTSENGFAAEQAVGFRSFDVGARKVEIWRQVRFCLPLVGCIGAPTQTVIARVVDSSPPTAASSGSYPISKLHGLKIETAERNEVFNAELEPIWIPTPIGPVTATPKVRFETHARAAAYPSTHVREYVDGVINPGANMAVYDLYGRMDGLDFSKSVYGWGGHFGQNGWLSQVGLGARGGSGAAVWVPLSSIGNPRPDFSLDRPRSSAEREPAVTAAASARFAYDPIALLPGLLRSTVLKFKQSELYVTPSIDAKYYGQLDVEFDETYTRPGDGSDKSYAQVNIPVSAGIDATTAIVAGLDLDIDACIPFLGCKDVVSAHPQIEVLSAKHKDFKSASARARNSLLTPLKTVCPGGAFCRLDTGSFDTFTPFHGTQSTPQTFVNQCLAQQPISHTPPQPSYEPGSATDEFIDGYEMICNVCLPVEEVHMANSYGSFDSTRSSMTMLPATSTAIGPTGWSCSYEAAKLGCTDVCFYNPATNEYTVIESATSAVSPFCAAPH